MSGVVAPERNLAVGPAALVIAADGTVEAATAGAEAVLGRSLVDLAGLDLAALVHTGDRRALRQRLRSVGRDRAQTVTVRLLPAPGAETAVGTAPGLAPDASPDAPRVERLLLAARRDGRVVVTLGADEATDDAAPGDGDAAVAWVADTAMQVLAWWGSERPDGGSVTHVPAGLELVGLLGGGAVVDAAARALGGEAAAIAHDHAGRRYEIRIEPVRTPDGLVAGIRGLHLVTPVPQTQTAPVPPTPVAGRERPAIVTPGVFCALLDLTAHGIVVHVTGPVDLMQAARDAASAAAAICACDGEFAALFRGDQEGAARRLARRHHGRLVQAGTERNGACALLTRVSGSGPRVLPAQPLTAEIPASPLPQPSADAPTVEPVAAPVPRPDVAAPVTTGHTTRPQSRPQAPQQNRPRAGRQVGAATPTATRRVTPGTVIATAFARSDLVTYHEPVIDLKTGRVVASGIVVRRRGADGTLPVPAPTGPLATSVTAAVLRTALADVRGYLPPGLGLVLCIPAAALRPGLARTVTGLAERSGTDPATVTLEIPHHAFGMPGATDVVAALRERGIRLVAGGAGHDLAAAALTAGGFSAISLDARRIAAAAAKDPAGVARHVTGLVDLARRLGIGVGAAGVGDPTTLARLTAAGVDVARGPLFATPQPVRALARIFTLPQVVRADGRLGEGNRLVDFPGVDSGRGVTWATGSETGTEG